MKDLKIFVACHKPSFVANRDFIYPVQVGCHFTKERFEGYLYDDEGDNISSKNKMYCELTAQYYAWKNIKADYYGFFHYRRYMSFSDEKLKANKFEDAIIPYADEKSIKKLNLYANIIDEYLNKYDIIATTEVDLKKLNHILKSNYHQYDITSYQYKEDLDILAEIIKEKYPQYYDETLEYYKSSKGYFCNMYIMRKDIFEEYNNILFDILEEHEKRRDYSNYTIQEYRVSGYLAERFFGIYFNYIKKHSSYRYTEVQRTLFENVEKIKDLKPRFEKNNVALALAANDYFIPYTATTIKSIIENSSKENNYDILLLTHDISDTNKQRLADMIKDLNNFSIRYLNPKRYLDDYDLYVRGHFGMETYYRLVLPEILQAYNKILYLDSDMVVMDDVAKLYNENIDGYMLAATLDADTAGLYNGYEINKKKYMDNIMKMKEPYKYFQAGTLLINLFEFRKNYTTEEILKVATAYKWELLDQDILNILCENKVKYIDMSWNSMVDMQGRRIKDIISLAPHYLQDMYFEARKNPKIIHYAGPQKPWLYPEMDMADAFFIYARNTKFYETILYRMGHCSVSDYYHSKKSLRINLMKIINKLFPYQTKRREFIKKIYKKIKR